MDRYPRVLRNRAHAGVWVRQRRIEELQVLRIEMQRVGHRSFRKARKGAKVRARTGPYPWRHTYASTALSASVAPALIAQQLGHSLSVLLSTYARWINSGSDRDELAK